MHTIELLERALKLAADLGIRVRQEWLEGASSATCEVRGKRVVFLDLSQSPREQLDQLLIALAADPRAPDLAPPGPLRDVLSRRAAA